MGHLCICRKAIVITIVTCELSAPDTADLSEELTKGSNSVSVCGTSGDHRPSEARTSVWNFISSTSVTWGRERGGGGERGRGREDGVKFSKI